MRPLAPRAHRRAPRGTEARNGRHTHVTRAEDGKSWRVAQTLVDPEDHNDWQAEFSVDLARAREEGRPLLRLLGLGPIANP